MPVSASQASTRSFAWLTVGLVDEGLGQGEGSGGDGFEGDGVSHDQVSVVSCGIGAEWGSWSR